MATSGIGRSFPCHSEANSATIHFRPPSEVYAAKHAHDAESVRPDDRPVVSAADLLHTTTRFAQPEGLLSSRMQARASSGVALPFSPIVIRLTATGPADADVALAVDRFEERAAGVA